MLTIHNTRSAARMPKPGAGLFTWGVVAAAALLAGCGNIPKAEIGYFLATTSVSVQVTRSVLCNAAGNPVVATTVVPTVTHRASDGKGAAQKLNLNWFRAPLSDADVKVELFDDGRLKSVNATTTGQGEAIVKAAVSLVTGAAAPVAAPEAAVAGAKPPTACDKINAQNKGEPILIVYSGELVLNPQGSDGVLKTEAGSLYYASLAEPLIGTVCAVVAKNRSPSAPMAEAGGDFTGGKLMVRQPGWADFFVRAQLPGRKCQTDDPPLFSGRVAVAQFGGEPYGIPISKPAAFGKQSVGLVFAESGALTSLQYTSAGSATQALGGLNSLAAAARGDAAAQKAADVKAQADLIAQQQRLVRCIADPANCPKE